MENNEKEMIISDISQVTTFLKETIGAYKKYGADGFTQEWVEWFHNNINMLEATLVVMTAFKKEAYQKYAEEIAGNTAEWQNGILKAVALQGVRDKFGMMCVALRKNPNTALVQYLVQKDLATQYLLGDSYRIRFPYQRWSDSLGRYAKDIIRTIIRNKKIKEEVGNNENKVGNEQQD